MLGGKLYIELYTKTILLFGVGIAQLSRMFMHTIALEFLYTENKNSVLCQNDLHKLLFYF